MKRKHKLSGATLLEVISSLALLSIIFIIGSLIFKRLGDIQSPTQMLKSRQVAEALLAEPIPFPVPERQEWELQGRRCERTIKVLVPEKGIVELSIVCYWGDRLLLSRQRIERIKRK